MVTRRAMLGAWRFGCVAFALVLGTVGCASTTPRGSMWTIRCLELSGPDTAARCEAVADKLRRTPGVRAKDVFVVDGADGTSRLFYGAYKRPVDSQTGKRAASDSMRRDLAWIRQLSDETGRQYFGRAMPARMPMPEVGNPAWNLAPVAGEYTLQVAVFEPTDEFGDYRQAAAELCKLLRREGFEAYYFHGSASSMVTIGVFGEDAVVVNAMGRTSYSSEVQTLQRHELLEHNLVNGGVMRVKNDNGVMVAVPSTLVRIPKQKDVHRP